MAPDTTPPTLLSRIRDPSDQEAWREFDARYRDLILRYARTRGLQVADAEDVRQAVMLSLSRSLRRFRYDPELGRFRSYLGRVVRNEVVRFLAKPTPAAGVLASTELERVADTAQEEANDELWEREWKSHHYRRALGKLRASFKEKSLEIFERALDGASADELASSFAMDREAVYKAQQRVRDQVRVLIAEQVRDEEFPPSD